MREVTGSVEKIIFRHPENGYCVLVLSLSDANDKNSGSSREELTVVGYLPDVEETEFLFVRGEMTHHPSYGDQLKAVTYEIRMPEGSVAMERYLSSGIIKGIGESLAKRIVKHFGEDTFRVLDQEPERLAEIRGISEKKAYDIAVQLQEKRSLREAMVFLQQYGISLNMATKIYNQYEEEVYTVLRENPYRLADDIAGIGFRKADEIARQAGIAEDSEFRVKTGIRYALNEASGMGHTYLPEDELVEAAEMILEVARETIEKCLEDLKADRLLINRPEGIYLAQSFYSEQNIASRLITLRDMYEPCEEELLTEEGLEGVLDSLEDSTGLVLEPEQREAVKAALTHGVCVITGGPGTGKTTIIKTMVNYFLSRDLDLLLAAPTGRAAKRMEETCGLPAKTIHRLLELAGGLEGEGGKPRFNRNEDLPLEADAIIIDEMSMVDVRLMHSLLKAVPVGTRLILVGDVNQLPSVGPGNVLKDILLSEAFATIRLTKIFRQAQESDIILNAHKIHMGEKVGPKAGSKDFLFVKRDDIGHVLGAMVTLISQKLPDYVKADPSDIQVLTPMRKGELGVERLNRELQEALNPASGDKPERELGSAIYRKGDKVMQIRNNYQREWAVYGEDVFGRGERVEKDKGIGVFNGDIGVIEDVNAYAEEVRVVFDDDRESVYSFTQLDELELAYAITIHKSQGSEYPAIIIPLISGPPMLMNRNLLYTAVTRARKCVVIVGRVETFQQMIDNEKEMQRYSGLALRIREIIEADLEDQMNRV